MLFKKTVLLVTFLNFWMISQAIAAGSPTTPDQNGSELVPATDEELLQNDDPETDLRNRVCRCEWLTAYPRQAAARSYEFCKRQLGDFFEGATQPMALRGAAAWINCCAVYVSLKTARNISRLQHQLTSRGVRGLPDEKMLFLPISLSTGYLPVIYQGAMSIHPILGLLYSPSLENTQRLASFERSCLKTAIMTLGVKSAAVISLRNVWPELQDMWDQIFIDEVVFVVTKLTALPFTITHNNQVYVQASSGMPRVTP